MGQIKLNTRDIEQIGAFILIGFALGFALSILFGLLSLREEKIRSGLSERVGELNARYETLMRGLKEENVQKLQLDVDTERASHIKKGDILETFRNWQKKQDTANHGSDFSGKNMTAMNSTAEQNVSSLPQREVFTLEQSKIFVLSELVGTICGSD